MTVRNQTLFLSGFIAIACIASVGCGRKAHYGKVKGKWAWVGHNAAVGTYADEFESDTKSFVILADPRYAKDRTRVFYRGRKVNGADPDSFVILPEKVGSYARDKDHVFLEGERILEADPDSFEVIDAPYARDRTRVYCGTVPMEGSDPASFQIMRMGRHRFVGTETAAFVYLNGDQLAGLDFGEAKGATTSSGAWAKDANHHYRDAAVVEGADYDTFQAVDDFLGVDKDHEYSLSFRKEVFEERARQRSDRNKTKREEPTDEQAPNSE